MHVPPPFSDPSKRELLESFTVKECAIAIEWLRQRQAWLFPQKPDDRINTPVQNLGLSARAVNALTAARLYTIKDIMNFGSDQLYYLRRVGTKTLQEITEAVNKRLEK